ncbi:bifunctional DNA-formamidopyrimidine glycosylase/DNA-(apurinic or apyrimidinic site) lyase [Parenemella sanctibonifatiensis]|uniref:Formamidopyrimidine-DNA glycosylase n=1 Tax=Parenemella sanctibonifatiensis TaxID=2016505 RepID=A0A255EIM3_9ACTN|nr:bifunctional DNA-formamidopyrimidine glycosylase/DNA-(apurinic or apyrimidinic site) lyase [Parenemella sanctibonifatiensis]OYN91367.1 DNA-formamidopyrimidine glycosylase [Parenemella sanctibonifatiensis]
MPELPEVEVVRSGLAAVLPERTISAVEVLHPRPVRRHLGGPEDFAARLIGRTFTEPRRRGKYLWLPLDDGDAVLAHLGMSGQFRIDAPGTEDQRHLRVRFRFTDGGDELRFVDQRMFGGLQLSPGGAQLPPEISHIAPDPFEDAFDVANVARRLRRRRGEVKRALLDQALVSGIGNIYADETLWRVRVHPERLCDRLRQQTAVALLEAAATVMAEALAQGGTSFDELYTHVNGESGYFERSLQAYGQEGLPCPRCGSTIVRQKWTNRSSHFCPRCQRRSS